MFPGSLVVFCVRLTSVLRVLGRSNSSLIMRPCHEEGVSSPMSGTVVAVYIILHIEIQNTASRSFVMASFTQNGPNGQWSALAIVERVRWLGMFAWSVTLVYKVRNHCICNSKAFENVCTLCMYPACAVTFSVPHYVERAPL